MTYNYSYNPNHRKLSQAELMERFEVMENLKTLFPYILMLEPINDIQRYPTKLLQDLYFELAFVEGALQFQNRPEAKRIGEQISYYQNIYYEDLTRFYQQQQAAEFAQQGYSPVGYGYTGHQHSYGQNGYYPQQGDYQQSQGYAPRQHERRHQEYRQKEPRSSQEGYDQRAPHQRDQYRKKDFHEKANQHTYNHPEGNHPPAVQPPVYSQEPVALNQEPVALNQEPVALKQEPVAQPVIQVALAKPEPKPVRFSISQIKEFINSFSKQDLEKQATPEVVQKAKEISGWKCEQVEVELREEVGKFSKKESKRGEGKGQQNIKTGGRRDEANMAERMGYKPKEEHKIQIKIGANESLETRQMKDELRSKAVDFATKKLQEENKMDQLEKDRRAILFNLNLIVPENLKDIEKDLVPFLYQDQHVCKVLVQETIKKAWDQPKYASTYAKLCYSFCKKHHSDFKFAQKDANPFKLFLVDSVQHSFDQRIEKFPQFQSGEDKELFLKEFKKRILSNVKFLAELIICKVLSKRIIKYCITQLFESFFQHFYAFVHDKHIEDSVYDYHYEAIIELIENVGETYDAVDEKQKEKGVYSYEAVRDHVLSILQVRDAPKKGVLEQMDQFSGDEYFQLLSFIDQSYMKKAFPRLSALLQNLVERRSNRWQKHLSVAEGPKKLKDIQEDIEREEDEGKAGHKHSRDKLEQDKLDRKVKEMYEGWQAGKHEETREMREILKKHHEHAFYLSLLKQLADEKKDNVAKRVTLLPLVMDYDRFKPQDFKAAWLTAVRYLAIGGEDFPFCAAALAKVLACAIERGGKLEEYHQKFDDEEEQYFNEEIVHKYYFYSKDQAALKFIKPKAKYSGLI